MMTDEEIQQAEKDARSDAEWLLLLLLISRRAKFRAEVGRFYVEGKSVSIATVRDYVRRIEKRVGKRLLDLTDQLEKGEITVRQWREGFERNVTSAHILAAALAMGSIRTAARSVNTQKIVSGEMSRIGDLAKRVKDGTAGTPSRMRGRITFYLTTVSVTYGVIEQLVQKTVGQKTEARRIRRASESCSGCIAYAYRWMPINEMPRIGSLNCGTWCRCYLEYR
jgi:hypothetical protein